MVAGETSNGRAAAPIAAMTRGGGYEAGKSMMVSRCSVALTEVVIRVLLQHLLERVLGLRALVRVEQAHCVVVARVEVGALSERGLQHGGRFRPPLELAKVVAE